MKSGVSRVIWEARRWSRGLVWLAGVWAERGARGLARQAERLSDEAWYWTHRGAVQAGIAAEFSHRHRRPIVYAAVILSLGNLAALKITEDRGQPKPVELAQLTLSNASRPVERMRLRREAPPAPAALQSRLNDLARAYGEPVGIAVSDVETGWVASVQGDRAFPQQSVSKLWVAMTVLDAVDKGRMGLDDPLVIGEADRSVFFQPVTYNIDEDGYQTTVRELMRKALIQSDNAANDKLISTLGGVGHVTAMLAAKNLPGIRLGANERELQAHVAGLTWRPELGEAGAFEAARAELPTETREAALSAYLANPMDGATPVGIVEALAATQRGELLSPASTEFLISTMAKARTGPRRLKGGLPEDWSIAHKTGTGQDWRGASVGINDVGLITAPDGRTYAVAVMLQRTHRPTPQRLELMQSVSRAVVETWQDSSPGGIQTASAR